ncbi:MAG: hypothetical protein ABMB14_15330 [Myxococcota bacterium]
MIAIDANALDVADVPGLTEYVNWLAPTYPVATEAAGQGSYAEISALYEGSNPFPVDIIIDKQGIIQYIAREYDPYTMDGIIQELLAAP